MLIVKKIVSEKHTNLVTEFRTKEASLSTKWVSRLGERRIPILNSAYCTAYPDAEVVIAGFEKVRAKLKMVKYLKFDKRIVT